MNTEHTPGPWVEIETETSVSLDYDDGPRLGGWSDIGPEAGAPIAIALGYGGFSDRRLDANARLIAAAPDMLDALISTRDSLQAMADEGIIAEGSWPTIDAAILKATGQ